MPPSPPVVFRLALFCLVLLAACGDGINEGAAETSATNNTSSIATDATGTTTDTAPTDTTSTGAAPTDTAPTDTTSTGAAPTDTARTDTARTNTAQTDTTATDPGPTDPGRTDPGQRVFGWKELSTGVQEGHLDVPIDYANPGSGSFTLYLVRHLAADPSTRIGSLLVNPGGPGYGGTDLAVGADGIYGKSVLDSFDIVAWDPRGTGRSTPAVDCVDKYDPFFSLDSSPDTAAERQAILDAAKMFGADCRAKNPKILPFVSTRDSARDMDAIRRALGEPKVSYFGFSYGSELGVTWASLFPTTVRAMVIDGAADQSVGYLQQNLEQAAGFERTFDTFLANCSKRPDCAFSNSGDAAGAFDTLSAAADASPVKTRTGRPDVTQGVLTTAVADAMYATFAWPQLERALADLQHGNGDGILSLYDSYYQRRADGTYGNELEAYFAINCLDDPGTKDPQVVFDMQGEFAKVAPRLGASWILELQFCAAWPVPAAPPVKVDAKGAGPVVVVGTTGDPATPLVSTRHMAQALEDGRLVVVTADQHTGYGVNSCVDSAVDNYLVALRAPSNELVCNK